MVVVDGRVVVADFPMAVTTRHSPFQHPTTWVTKLFIVTCCNKLIVCGNLGWNTCHNAPDEKLDETNCRHFRLLKRVEAALSKRSNVAGHAWQHWNGLQPAFNGRAVGTFLGNLRQCWFVVVVVVWVSGSESRCWL
jgi:hypothetical protein